MISTSHAANTRTPPEGAGQSRVGNTTTSASPCWATLQMGRIWPVAPCDSCHEQKAFLLAGNHVMRRTDHGLPSVDANGLQDRHQCLTMSLEGLLGIPYFNDLERPLGVIKAVK